LINNNSPKRFIMATKMIYLDNAATSFPKPESVYSFMDDFYRNHGVSPGRTGFDAGIETEEFVHSTRLLLTQLFNGNDASRLTFSHNASDSLNMIIQGVLEKGNHVITTMLEHNSVLRPLHHLRQQGLIDVTYVPFDENGYINPDDIKKSIRKNTRMAIVNHSSNVLGTVQPVETIGKICQENGVYFVVDGCQSAGVTLIDVEKFAIDALIFTGHKSLMGPTGIGGSYVSERLPVKATRFGGTGVRSAQETHLTEFPWRLECGTLNTLGIAGLNAGVKWLLNEGMDKIHGHEMMLYHKMMNTLKDTDGITTFCSNNRDSQNAVLSFVFDGLQAGEAGTFLDVDYNIAVRTGLQCAPMVHKQLNTFDKSGTVRISIGPFNTIEQIDVAIEAVKEIAGFRR